MSIERTTPPMDRMGRGPIKRFEMPGGVCELFEVDDLPEDEKAAVLGAVAAYHKSDNPEFRAGASVVGMNGQIVSTHNEKQGPAGHAEMLAIEAFYRAVKPGEFDVKAVALAASYPTEEIVTVAKYGPEVELDDIETHSICGRCRKFIHDYTSGNAIDADGNEDKSKDVALLLYTKSGQVLRTTLRAFHPIPHKPNRVSIDNLQPDIHRAPSFFEGKKFIPRKWEYEPPNPDDQTHYE